MAKKRTERELLAIERAVQFCIMHPNRNPIAGEFKYIDDYHTRRILKVARTKVKAIQKKAKSNPSLTLKDIFGEDLEQVKSSMETLARSTGYDQILA